MKTYVPISNSSAVQKPAGDARVRLQAHYDGLWAEAVRRIRAGKIESDSILRAGVPDRRRGLTVIARPVAAVRQRVAAFLKELQRLEPEQYYYIAPEFHVTVLSLFTATVEFEPFFARQDRYVAAVDAALKEARPMRVEFAGVTASPGTVMIQGFFEDNALDDLRDILRRQLQKQGLGAGVDQRYRLQTAHMTVVRFRNPLRDSRRFAQALEKARQRPFGAATFRSFSLVENDWYMSHRATQTIKRYPLARAGQPSSSAGRIRS